MARGIPDAEALSLIHIFLSSILLWFLMNFGFENSGFGMVEDLNNSVLATIGNAIAWIFSPLGWGNWQSAVATITGLIAKENVVGTFGVLFGGFEEVAENGWQIWVNMREVFTPLAAYSFLCLLYTSTTSEFDICRGELLGKCFELITVQVMGFKP